MYCRAVHVSPTRCLPVLLGGRQSCGWQHSTEHCLLQGHVGTRVLPLLGILIRHPARPPSTALQEAAGLSDEALKLEEEARELHEQAEGVVAQAHEPEQIRWARCRCCRGAGIASPGAGCAEKMGLGTTSRAIGVRCPSGLKRAAGRRLPSSPPFLPF